MSAFEALHPTLQHHIVNSLGWRSLRPLQKQSIEAVMAGQHVIMLAPTAGGKTEACLFPLFSKMLFENWNGLSILYICPLKALLNNLNTRIQEYTSLIGRKSDVWHGDTSQTKRKKIFADPPDCLLTTPESIEAMLISTRTDHASFFANIHAVVVDEIHALAGDDRGWHLLSILERLTKIAGREIQRIGLSATVGNPEKLLKWLSFHCEGVHNILLPSSETKSDVDITIDYVGSLGNAAVILSRLYRGQKRLVYCDSRSRVEQLSAELKGYGIKTYASHSSLSVEERKRSENAFHNEKDCIIVATSALELGIDIGDLDRVIQVDAPATVSSFLQRLGRTGRREGATKNCLFLATTDQALIQTAGLIDLFQSGFVEPIIPPPSPYHVLVQQIIGLLLQEKGIGTNTWKGWIARLPVFKEMAEETVHSIFRHMLKKNIISHDQGIIWFGQYGEKLYGYKNFMEICSTFISPPLFEVRYGKDVIGYVDEITFADYIHEQIILLAGKGWKVKQVHWDKKIADVEPTSLLGKSSWIGSGPFWSKELCLAIKKILLQDDTQSFWSKRAAQKIHELRSEFGWIEDSTTVMVQNSDKATWWTFAGKLTNINIANIINHKFEIKANADNLAIHIDKPFQKDEIEWLRQVNLHLMTDILASKFFDSQKTAYKFHECLPESVVLKTINDRFVFPSDIHKVLDQSIVQMTF